MKAITALAAALALACPAACSTGTNTAQLSADLGMLITDIQADAAGKTLTPAQSAIFTQQLATMSADLAALNAGSAGATASSVMANVITVVDTLAPFLPDIAALISLAAKPGVQPVAAVRLKLDYARVKADVAT